MSAISRVFAALKESKQVPVYVKQTSVVVTKMTGSAWFANPPIALSLVETHISDLEKSEEAAHKGPKGSAQVRNVNLGIVRADMRLLKAFVQSIADANPANAKAIIESAGMYVSKKTPRTKLVLTVKYGKAPGQVRLVAKSAGPGTTYYWQMSTDEKTWTSLPDTRLAKTTVDGLTAATRYYFRFRTMTKDGLSDWCVAVDILAH